MQLKQIILLILSVAIILACLILLANRAKYLYYHRYLRAKIFPYQISDIKLNADLSTEHYYQKIMAATPITPTDQELRFLLQYKRFVDATDTYSMASPSKVDQMAKLIGIVSKNGIEGSIVETGVWKGGMGMWIKCCLKYHKNMRDVWLFDTFEYFPEPSSSINSINKADQTIHAVTEILFENMPTVAKVSSNFERFGLLDETIKLVPGAFEKTIPTVDTGPIAILRLDSDYYDSTMYVLEALYPRLVAGGFVVIDDYGNNYVACRQAVEDYRSKYLITDPIRDRHYSESVYWMKSG